LIFVEDKKAERYHSARVGHCEAKNRRRRKAMTKNSIPIFIACCGVGTPRLIERRMIETMATPKL